MINDLIFIGHSLQRKNTAASCLDATEIDIMALTALFEILQQHDVIELPLGWSQGRTVYGGLVAAILLHKAMSYRQDASQHLLSTTVTFVGPVSDAPARISVEVLRQGKSVTTIEARLWQEDVVQTILLASFGQSRPSKIVWDRRPVAPDFPPVDDLQVIVPIEGLMPQCYQQFELAWAHGQYPCTASKQPDFGGYCRFHPDKHRNTSMNEAYLMALVDIWPPGVLPMFRQVAPASSLTWHLTYLEPLQCDTHDWLKYQVVTELAADGYSSETAHIWQPNGRLVAICRQTVTVFA